MAGPLPIGHYRAGITGLPTPFQNTAEDAVRCLLRLVGVDPDSGGLKDTPKRVVKALQEITVGYGQDPADILGKVFEEAYDEIVVLRAIPFTSICEHHLMSFTGTACVGYLPGDKGVVGLSKLARLVDCFALRLQVQERLTKQIADAVSTHLGARAVGVVVRASHSCMACRGVRKPGAEMVTSCMMGAFRTEPSARAEFFKLCEG